MGFPELLQAAKNNDVVAMKRLLAKGEDANGANQIGQTALHVASIWGCKEVTVMLLNARANVNAVNQFGITPLHSAAASKADGCYDVAQVLIEAGADITLSAQNGLKPYEAAKDSRMRELCGAPTLKLHAAVMASDQEAIKAILAEGSTPLSEQDSDGDTPLHLAVKFAVGDPPVPLVEEMNAPDVMNSTTLTTILSFPSPKGLAAAHFCRDGDGLMPIHVAASKGDVAVCALLLRSGASVNGAAQRVDELHNGQWGKKDGKSGAIVKLEAADKTPLHHAVGLLLEQYEDDEDAELDAGLVRMLLEHGADVNALDLDAQTPLHIAIMGQMYEVVELLAEAKADMTLSCKTFGKNNTALHQATMLRDIKMINILAKHGAPMDAHGRDGWTPLALAVRSGAEEVARALIAAGADAHAISGKGSTPLEVATINNRQTLIELLKSVEVS